MRNTFCHHLKMTLQLRLDHQIRSFSSPPGQVMHVLLQASPAVMVILCRVWQSAEEKEVGGLQHSNIEGLSPNVHAIMLIVYSEAGAEAWKQPDLKLYWTHACSKFGRDT